MTEFCKYCGSDTLEYTEDHELLNPETDTLEKHNGFLCITCGCFHDIQDEFYQFDIDPHRKESTRFIPQG